VLFGHILRDEIVPCWALKDRSPIRLEIVSYFIYINPFLYIAIKFLNWASQIAVFSFLFGPSSRGTSRDVMEKKRDVKTFENYKEDSVFPNSFVSIFVLLPLRLSFLDMSAALISRFIQR
jgi:hypothetical protein